MAKKKNTAPDPTERSEPGSLLSSTNRSIKSTMANQNRSTEDLIRKSLHAGHVYQLTHKKTETEASLRIWFENFLSLFEVEEQTIIQKTNFLWRKDDILKAQTLLLFPAKREQLATLFNQGRLAEDMFVPPLTDAELNVLTDTEGAELDYAIKKEGTTPVCDTCRRDCVGTCAGHRRVYNTVISHITNGTYKTAPDAFADATSVRKALSKFQNTMKRFILPELLEAFSDGMYLSWKALCNAIRRAFNVKEEKQTLSNLYTRIHNAATSAISMENKINTLAAVVKEIAITDKKNFFRPINFEGDMSQTMTVPEQVGPMVHTLLSYIIIRESVSMTKLDQIQEDFERKIQSGWSYQRWHENRPQLYDIVDKMKKNPGSVSAIGNELTGNSANQNETESEAQVNSNHDDGAICPVFPKHGKYPKKSYNNDRSGNNHSHPPISQEDRRKACQQAPQKRHCLCLNCSHFHPNKVAVYHPEGSGFGGKGKFCLYDTNGKERSDARGRGIQSIGGELKPIEADGPFPIMADIEMFDPITDNDMKTTWGFDLAPPRD